jgi:hypothetical protein
LDLHLLLYLLARVRLYMRPCLGWLLTMHTSFHPIQLVYIAEIFPTALRSRATASKKHPTATRRQQMKTWLTLCEQFALSWAPGLGSSSTNSPRKLLLISVGVTMPFSSCAMLLRL